MSYCHLISNYSMHFHVQRGNEKKRYKWTGNNAMGAYFVSATSSHYHWATKHLKRDKKV